jgi:hypothetical protein
MTLRQLEKKAKQLLYRKRLAGTIGSIEDRIRAHMQVEEKKRVKTRSFVIRLAGDKLFIDLLPKIDPRQLSMKFNQEV